MKHILWGWVVTSLALLSTQVYGCHIVDDELGAVPVNVGRVSIFAVLSLERYSTD